MHANPKRVQNTCQSAGPHGIGRYDCSCPLTVSQGVQCRTMPSQRPCHNPNCVRDECSRAHASAQVFMDATNDGTENGSMPSESAPQTSQVQEPLYTLTDLSARDVERLEQALRMLRRTYTRESPMYAEVSALGHRVSGLK